MVYCNILLHNYDFGLATVLNLVPYNMINQQTVLCDYSVISVLNCFVVVRL